MHHGFAIPEGLFPTCHSASVAEVGPEAGGGLVAACFAGTAEGAASVHIVVARRRLDRRGPGWGPPRALPDEGPEDGATDGPDPDVRRRGPGSAGGDRAARPSPDETGDRPPPRWTTRPERHPSWNPVLHAAADGTLVLFWKSGPSPSGWWGMVSRSRDGGETWSAPERLPEGHWGPIRNKVHRRADGSLLCPSSTEMDGWKVHFESCTDHGRGWSRTPSVPDPHGLSAIQPTILDHGGGRLQALCRTHGAGVVAETLSDDDGRTWTPLRRTDLPNNNCAIDGLRPRDGRFVLVLNPVGMIDGWWSGLRTPLVLAVGPDGTTWDGVTLLEDGPGEYSYPAVFQDSAGTVHVVYTGNKLGIRHVELDPREIGQDGPLPLVSPPGRGVDP